MTWLVVACIAMVVFGVITDIRSRCAPRPLPYDLYPNGPPPYSGRLITFRVLMKWAMIYSTFLGVVILTAMVMEALS